MMLEHDESRRSAIKKSAAFVLPAIATFQLSDLAVAASGMKRKGGNHYGDTKRPDMNPNDKSKWNKKGYNDNQGPM